MKRIIVLGFLFQIMSIGLHAQTLNEWVKQKKTQIQYLTQQIAALQVYGEYLNKGYEITKHGLGTIEKGKGDEFALHKTFFSSFSLVNPSLKKDVDVADIILLQSQILLKSKKCKKGVRSNSFITNDERNYISLVLDNLVTGCVKNLTNLTSLITDNTLQLSDDERLWRIKDIHADMQDRYAFVSGFGNDVNVLVHNRLASKQSLNSLQNFYLLKQY